MTGHPDLAAGPGQEIPTVHGPARVRVVRSAGTGVGGTLLLGHGAGGQRDAADVLALTTLAAEGWTIVLVDQPWRVAGRKVASPPPSLDRAWLDVLGSLRGTGASDHGAAPDGTPLPRPWVYGGRSAGARVAARTSLGDDGRPVDGVVGVLCLAFPLHPPGRPERSRAEELARPVDAHLPTLVIQGQRDPMGTPEEIRSAVAGDALQLQAVPGTHSPSRDLTAVTHHASTFLAGLRRGRTLAWRQPLPAGGSADDPCRTSPSTRSTLT